MIKDNYKSDIIENVDFNCIPYPRKGLYWIINIPYITLFILTAIYLWNYSVLVSSVFISFYLVSVLLHGYICAFSDCPYTGTMCPGGFGWSPVGKIAYLYQKLKVHQSVFLTNLFFLIIMISLLGVLIFPLYWISNLGIIYCVGYVLFIMGYFFSFLITICPKCAGRLKCPTAKLSNLIYKKILHKDILKYDQ